MYDIAHLYAAADFSRVASVEILSYNPLELTPYGRNKSNVIVKGRYDLTDELILCVDKYAWLVSACVPSNDNDTTTVTLAPFFQIFDRWIPYTAQAGGVTAQLQMDIYTHFTVCSDAYYARAYIMPVSGGASRYNYAPAVSESGMYNLRDYINSMAPYVGVYLIWTSSGIELRSIDREDYTYEVAPDYDTDGGAEQLTRVVFTRELISKVTYYNKTDGTSRDYYLLDDGTVTTDGTAANRVRGRWILYEAEDANIGLITAQFARSEYSHSIELMTRQQAPAYYSRCRVRLPSGAVISSHVTSIIASSDDDRLKIKAGRAAVTLSEVIQEIRANG